MKDRKETAWKELGPSDPEFKLPDLAAQFKEK